MPTIQPSQIQPSLSAALSHRMNHLVARQGVVAGNVANSETPNFKARDLGFKKLFDSNSSIAMATTNSKHLNPNGAVSAGNRREHSNDMVLDGNSVQLDQEMLKLNEIQLNYRMATQLYSKQVAFQKMAIGRGR
ncbi:MAG: flagellar basal body rod protein FlgB [Alphaproteobacteria bacterium]